MTKKSTIVVADASRPRDDDPAPMLPSVSTSPVSDAAQIMAAIARVASDRDFDPDKMLKLLEFREVELRRIARMQFIEAMAKFKQNPPKIVKDKHVYFEGRDGKRATDYWHATLPNVVAQVIDGLAAVGISHAWKTRHEGALIYVSCVLTHAGGHEDVTPFPPVSPDQTGNKNPIQAVQSAKTYAQRYSLLDAIGLSASDDDDARKGGGGGEKDYERITESQVADLAALLDETGGNKVKLLAWLGLETLADIRAENYKSTCDLVREQGKKRGTGK